MRPPPSRMPLVRPRRLGMPVTVHSPIRSVLQTDRTQGECLGVGPGCRGKRPPRLRRPARAAHAFPQSWPVGPIPLRRRSPRLRPPRRRRPSRAGRTLNAPQPWIGRTQTGWTRRRSVNLVQRWRDRSEFPGRTIRALPRCRRFLPHLWLSRLSLRHRLPWHRLPHKQKQKPKPKPKPKPGPPSVRWPTLL